MASLSDLLSYCRSQARIEARDYIDPWSRGDRLQQEISEWRHDRRRRDSARCKCFARFPGRCLGSPEKEPLKPGRYGCQGRLEILPNGEPDYTAGQYAPVEIYNALLSYLEATNA